MKTKIEANHLRLVTPVRGDNVTMHGRADIYAGNELIAETVELHLAASIVRAVKSHAALLQAAENAVETLGKMKAFGEGIGEGVSKPQIAILLNQLTQAIAQANSK